MAKIRIKTKGGHTHQVGRTIFTTKLMKYADDDHAIRYEAWRLRSDGDVQRRVIRSTDVDPVTGETIRVVEHRGSSFVSFGSIKRGPYITEDFLETWLKGRRYHIVKKEN